MEILTLTFVCLFVCVVEPAPEAAHRGGAEAAEQLEEEELGAPDGGGGGRREQQLHSQLPVPEAQRAAEQVGGSAGRQCCDCAGCYNTLAARVEN